MPSSKIVTSNVSKHYTYIAVCEASRVIYTMKGKLCLVT